MKYQINQIVANHLSNGQIIICRIVEILDADMVRVTDARETKPDTFLIAHNRTWAAPLENLKPHGQVLTHKNGLIGFEV